MMFVSLKAGLIVKSQQNEEMQFLTWRKRRKKGRKKGRK